MYKLVLLRHGESVWNKENRFTGWTDKGIGLSEKGTQEAIEAGKTLKDKGFNFKVAYTSFLRRGIKTLWLVLEEMDLMWIPVYKSWRLNEKHYGVLQGLNKIEMAKKYGDEKVLMWRRSFDVPPEPLPEDDPRHPINDPRYQGYGKEAIPGTEALINVVKRIIPYWENEITPALKEHKEVLVAAHGNSLRAMVKFLKNMPDEEVVNFNIPTGIPYVFEFDENMKLLSDNFIGDPEKIKELMQQVANQTKEKK
jgi:2,3-bisphosphoglycerate-dependent phosphoglycerate mutase